MKKIMYFAVLISVMYLFSYVSLVTGGEGDTPGDSDYPEDRDERQAREEREYWESQKPSQPEPEPTNQDAVDATKAAANNVIELSERLGSTSTTNTVEIARELKANLIELEEQNEKAKRAAINGNLPEKRAAEESQQATDKARVAAKEAVRGMRDRIWDKSNADLVVSQIPGTPTPSVTVLDSVNPFETTGQGSVGALVERKYRQGQGELLDLPSDPIFDDLNRYSNALNGLNPKALFTFEFEDGTIGYEIR